MPELESTQAEEGITCIWSLRHNTMVFRYPENDMMLKRERRRIKVWVKQNGKNVFQRMLEDELEPNMENIAVSEFGWGNTFFEVDGCGDAVDVVAYGGLCERLSSEQD
jgi:hypothetical protein